MTIHQNRNNNSVQPHLLKVDTVLFLSMKVKWYKIPKSSYDKRRIFSISLHHENSILSERNF